MSNQKGSLQYAQELAVVPLIGIRYLVVRDLPHLIKKFVNGTKVLDYGCGTGFLTKALKSFGLDVDAVDINEHMLDFAKKLEPGCNYYLIESAKVPTDSDNYVFAFIAYVLVYCETKSEIITILKELARVLKPGATLIIGAPHENFYKYKWLHEDSDFEENKNPVSGSIVKFKYRDLVYTSNHYYWNREDYCDAISKAGLDLVHIHEPLGYDNDGIAWTNEKKIPITDLYVATKKKLILIHGDK